MSKGTEKVSRIIKLSQNENAFGAPPLAIKAIKDNYHNVFRYPDVLHEELKHKLSEKHNVPPERLLISAGSIALMDISVKTFVKYKENVLTAETTFIGYKQMAKINRKACKFAKLIDNTINLKEMRRKCDARTRLIFIANPNNPTGTMVTHSEFETFLRLIPADVYVVIDEAYAEYMTDPEYPDSLRLQKKFPNLIIFRTFSKIYGLAGLRIGYAIAHQEVIESMVRCKTPFSINGLSAIAASAALDDREYIERCGAINAEERMVLFNELKNLGFKATPPKGNFIFVEFDQPQEKDKIDNLLRDDGVLIRPEPFGTENSIRITVGRPEENRHLIECLSSLKLTP